MMASMSDLAASGGYYVAMPAETIVAQPGTLTGSIGMFSGKVVIGGTLGKTGVEHRDRQLGCERGHLLTLHARSLLNSGTSSGSTCRSSTRTSSRRWQRHERRRPRRFMRLPRGVCGPGAGACNADSSTNSAASIGRWRWPGRREDSRRRRGGARALSGPSQLYEAMSEQFGGTGSGRTLEHVGGID